jgi:hypothetical protein
MVCNRLPDDSSGQRSAPATSPDLKEDITVEGAGGPTKITSYFEDIYASIRGAPEDRASSAAGDGSSAAPAIAKANLAGPAPSRDGTTPVPDPSALIHPVTANDNGEPDAIAKSAKSASDTVPFNPAIRPQSTSPQPLGSGAETPPATLALQTQPRNPHEPSDQEQSITARAVSFGAERRQPTIPTPDPVEQARERSVEAKAREHLAEAKPSGGDELDGAKGRGLAPAMPAEPSSSRQKPQRLAQDVVPSTPKAQIDQGEQKSPPTEDVPRVSLPPDQSLTLQDMVAEGLVIIHKMSSLQQAAPTETHSAVLRALQAGLQDAGDITEATPRSGSIWATQDPRSWSTDMWIRLLDAGTSRNKKTTLLNIIEWIGASA